MKLGPIRVTLRAGPPTVEVPGHPWNGVLATLAPLIKLTVEE